jgi:hypothetical protein
MALAKLRTKKLGQTTPDGRETTYDDLHVYDPHLPRLTLLDKLHLNQLK